MFDYRHTAHKEMVNKMLDDKVKVTETVYAHSRYTDKEGISMACRIFWYISHLGFSSVLLGNPWDLWDIVWTQ